MREARVSAHAGDTGPGYISEQRMFVFAEGLVLLETIKCNFSWKPFNNQTQTAWHCTELFEK